MANSSFRSTSSRAKLYNIHPSSIYAVARKLDIKPEYVPDSMLAEIAANRRPESLQRQIKRASQASLIRALKKATKGL